MSTKQKTKETSNSTQTVAPPSWTMPGIQDLAAKVTEATKSLPGTAYTGDFTALPNMGLTNNAIDAYSKAASMGGELADYTRGLTDAAKPNYSWTTALPTTHYDLGSGMDLQPKITAAIAPVLQQLQEQVLPGLRSSAIDAGAYSGSRAMTQLPELALRDFSTSAGNIAANIGYQDYNDRENRRLAAYNTDSSNALAGYGAETSRNLGMQSAMQQYVSSLPDLVDTALRAQSSSGDLYSGAANLDATARQAIINNDLAKAQYSYMQPFQGMDIAAALLSQLSGNYGTQTTNGTRTTTQTSGGLGSVVQGVAGLASLAGSFPGASTALSGLFKRAATGAVPAAANAVGGLQG